MNVAHTFVRCLEKVGVSYVFGVPGEETLDLLAALKESSIQFVPTRHEQGAAFMASTCGRLTGIPGVCLTTLGPGALNTMTGIAYAYLGQMPMLLISGQKPIGEVKQGNFQMIDVVDSMQSITLSSQRLVKADAVSSLLYNALAKATQFPRGPVHIELAEDIAKKTVSQNVAKLDPIGINTIPAAGSADISHVADLIQNAKSPLLIIGQHASRPEVSAALRNFVEQTQIAFATTQMGKGAVDETHDLYVGSTALSDNDFVHKIADQADLLLMVGHNESEKPPVMACCHARRVIHIDDIAPVVHETYFPSDALVGDLALTLERLGEQLQSVAHETFTALKSAFLSHEESLKSNAIPLQIVDAVREAMPADGIVALDNGMYKIWFTRHYRAQQPQSLLLDNALATMGAGLPSAMATSLLYPTRAVLAVCGDGGFMMSAQELETALRLKLNLTVLILRDNKFGMIRWKQEMDGYEDYGLDFGNPDFAAMAESFGAHGHRVGETSQLAAQVKQCHEMGGVHVIETPIDYSADHIFAELDMITKGAVEA